MSITHKQNSSVVSDAGGSSLQGSQSEVGASEIAIDQQYGASLSNQLLTLAITVANIQSLFLLSDKGLVIKTNSSSSPANTITLKPGTPLVWSKSAAYYTCPLTVDVTAFYITTTAASRLQAKVLTT